MEPITLALAGLGGAANIFGSWSQRQASKDNTRRTIQANKELAEYAYQKDLEMWNRANEYNRPEAQMQRLVAAGLNPNLVYGSGQVVGNTSTQTPKYNAPRVDYEHEAFAPDMIPVLHQFSDMYIKSAQRDNLEAQNRLITQQVITEGLKGANMGANTAKTEFDLKLAKQLEQYSLEAARENLRKTRADIEMTSQSMRESMTREEANKLDNELSRMLKKHGFTARDPAWLRFLVNLLSKPGKATTIEDASKTYGGFNLPYNFK